ncbi:MAG: hypothetical protein RMJ43_07700 [Chloroherpetonaceae bacterium]|nr:hypothetical protein [Chthonomonadaceae bacterium]MDW8207706.1 hypothetical protein [Chloroherpetonaceae bacterium]
MHSFELVYEAEEDVLEVTFADYEEHFARSVALNDNILMHADIGLGTVWGLTFYAYTQLLQVNETQLDGLQPLSEIESRRILTLLCVPPASYFLEIISPGDLLARVKAPHLQDLIG